MNRCLRYVTPMLLALLPAPIWAATHDELQYEVMNAKLSWHLVGET